MTHSSLFSPAATAGARAAKPGLWLFLIAVSVLISAPARATSNTIKVPQQYPTIQGAVDAASAGDVIEVAKGKFCGATITKRLTLVSAKKGGATIIGCAASPILVGPLRVGFLLAGAAGTSPASGSKIRGFVFDGKGVSGNNLSPLSFGVYARFSHHITVEDNKFLGTVQAITNTAGDNWRISDNEIQDLTVFDCTGSLCGGGVGIAIQVASAAVGVAGGAINPVNRPEANAVVANDIQGKAPAGFDAFGMDGILAFAADGTAIVKNKTKLTPGVASSDPLAVGVLVTNTCCDDPAEFLPGSRYTAVILNQDASQFGVVVEGTGGANTLGLVLFGNQGSEVVEGAPAAAIAAGGEAALRTAIAAPGKPRRTRFE